MLGVDELPINALFTFMHIQWEHGVSDEMFEIFLSALQITEDWNKLIS